MNDFEIIQTGDGTVSLYSRKYRETMHSRCGAYNEALRKHVLPSGILERPGNTMHVIDIGFGIGYNVLALLEAMENLPINKRYIHVLSFDRDLGSAQFMEHIKFSGNRETLYNSIRTAAHYGKYTNDNYTIEIILGDARKTLSTIGGPGADAVFHDPYSPSKNPELWSVEFFSLLKRSMKNDAILTTYSSAAHIRMAMLHAGFIIGKGPSVGKKREGTLATPEAGIERLSEAEIEDLKNDIKSIPYRDTDLNDVGDEILVRRIKEMKIKRGHPIH